MKAMRIAAVAVLVVLGAGCAPRYPERELSSAREREMTVGVVQREIRVGLSQDQVAEALGSPNIVTRDANGNETWIYDKVASEASYSTSDRYGTILILGGSSAQGASSNTQRTLTVIIKFDAGSQVESFSYHASKF